MLLPVGLGLVAGAVGHRGEETAKVVDRTDLGLAGLGELPASRVAEPGAQGLALPFGLPTEGLALGLLTIA